MEMNQHLNLLGLLPDPIRHQNDGSALGQTLDGDAQDLALLPGPRVWSHLSGPLGLRPGRSCRLLRRRLFRSSGRPLEGGCGDGSRRRSLNQQTNGLVASQAL